MTKILFAISLFAVAAFGKNGSAGFRGGGDAIAADVQIIASEWIKSQKDFQKAIDLIAINQKLQVITYSSYEELGGIDYKIIRHGVYPTFISVHGWQRLSFEEKVKLVITELILHLPDAAQRNFEITEEYNEFKKYACADPEANLCYKFRERLSIHTPEASIIKLAKHLFWKLKWWPPTEDDDVTIRRLIVKVANGINDVTVYEVEGPLKLDGVYVNAINDRVTKSIYVDLTKWKSLTPEQRAQLVIHEYISVWGYNDKDYELTNELCKRL